MTFWSMMMVKVLEGQAEEAAQVWIKNRIVEAAAETIPGFLHGEVMLSTDEPDQVCVMCGWEDKAAYEEWQSSPVRAKITTDLSSLYGMAEQPCSREDHHWSLGRSLFRHQHYMFSEHTYGIEMITVKRAAATFV